ncbi:hypothetical protein, partial [Staphylococcus aureus]
KHFSIMGWGPNTEADEKSAYNNVQVGDGPQHREFQKEILQTMQVGAAPNTENDFAFLLDSKSHLIFCVLI